MGHNNAKALGSQGKTDCLWFDPEALTIVEDDPKHPHHDERPSTAPESLVLDIMRRGITQPIRIARAGNNEDDTPILHVIVGRKRVRSAREANRRLAEMGKPTVKVPALIIRGDESELFGVTISENEHREATSLPAKCRQLQRYMAFGASKEDALVTFGISASTFRNYQTFLELAPEVQKAVEDDKLSFDAAIDMAKLSHDMQRAALTDMLKAGATKGNKAKQAVANAKQNKKAEPTTEGRKRSKRFLFKAVEALDCIEDDNEAKTASAMIRFMMGEDKALRSLPGSVRSVLREIMKAQKGKVKE